MRTSDVRKPPYGRNDKANCKMGKEICRTGLKRTCIWNTQYLTVKKNIAHKSKGKRHESGGTTSLGKA